MLDGGYKLPSPGKFWSFSDHLPGGRVEIARFPELIYAQPAGQDITLVRDGVDK
jgi:hypothetical protein